MARPRPDRLLIFRLNDKVSIKRIISNHSLSGLVSPEQINHYYYYCIKQQLGFLLIDLKQLTILKDLDVDLIVSFNYFL